MNEIITFFAALSAGICCGCVVFLIFNALRSIEIDSSTERHEDFRKKLPLLIKLFLPLTPNIVPLLDHEGFDVMKKNVSNLLQMAGYDQTISTEQFIAARICLLVLGFLFAALLGFSGKVIYGLVLLALLYIYPMAWLKKVVARRQYLILRALPNLLDLLTLSVEAGKDFLSALRDILACRKIDPLGEEMTRALQEIQLGKKRQTALKEMANRVQQSELTSVVNSIVQADELGISIGQLLRIQSDQLRSKRFSMAEKLANEAPVKILIPVVVFIFPSVFLLLMGPIILQAMKMMG